MKYLMMVYGNAEIWGGLGREQFGRFVAEVDAFNTSLRESGELVSVEGLAYGVKAIRPGVEGGAPVVSDGPYLETKEHVGSYTVLDVASEERALEIVASYPQLRYCEGGGLELWPLRTPGGGADA